MYAKVDMTLYHSGACKGHHKVTEYTIPHLHSYKNLDAVVRHQVRLQHMDYDHVHFNSVKIEGSPDLDSVGGDK